MIKRGITVLYCINLPQAADKREVSCSSHIKSICRHAIVPKHAKVLWVSDRE